MSRHAAPLMAPTGVCTHCLRTVERTWNKVLGRPLWARADHSGTVCMASPVGIHQCNPDTVVQTMFVIPK